MGVDVATLIQVPVRVHRTVRDGWHVYTCEQLPGLYVASKDQRKAYGDVPIAIQALIKLDFGVDCLVAHKVEYQDIQEIGGFSERTAETVADRTAAWLSGEDGDVSFVIQCVQHRDADA